MRAVAWPRGFAAAAAFRRDRGGGEHHAGPAAGRRVEAAICFALGYRDHDEKRIDELAHMLHSVIVDNPDLFSPAEVGHHERSST